MEVTVDVYGGSRRVPNGSSHPTILNQFNDELSSLAQQAAASGLSGFEKPAVPSACTYGALYLPLHHLQRVGRQRGPASPASSC